MFRIKSAILCFLLLAFHSSAQDTLKVAFLGNSYTYYNSLPNLIDQLANADGNDLIHSQNTPGGYTLLGHTTNVTSLNLIASDAWDFVVLQEQSQLPSFPYSQVITDVYPYAKLLCDSIRSANACAIPVFYNTWGRLNGDPQWDSINTFEKMNGRLYNAYNVMADDNSGLLSPVGLAFKAVYDDPSAIVLHADLYENDGSHPSIYGSYLAACIFYNTLFGANAAGNTFVPNGISVAEANYLQDIAASVMFMATSPIFDYTYPQATFSATAANETVQFNNESTHAFTYNWDFGDNTSSTEENPIHIYQQNGTYLVTLTALYCDRSSTYQQTIIISSLNVNETPLEAIISPNPVIDIVKIQLNRSARQIRIIAVDGRIVYANTDMETNYTIDLVSVPTGVYFIEIESETEKTIQKIIKQ
jgi:PKD repeat protein